MSRAAARRLGRNFTVAASAHVAARLMNLALLAILGRQLGAEALGTFAVATALGTCFSFVADLGLAPRLFREASARPGNAAFEYARALGAKLAILLPLVLAAAALWVTLPADRGLAELAALMAIAGVLESFSVLNHALCRAHERFDLEAAGELTQALVALVAGAAIIMGGLSLVALGYAAILAAIAELVVSTQLARRFARLGLSLRSPLATLHGAAPYATAGIGAAALAQLDVLVLSLVATPAVVGRYAAVSRLLLGGAYLPMLAADVALPSATMRYVAADASSFRASARASLRVVALAAVAAAALVAIASPWIVQVVYGPAFQDVYGLLRLGSLFVALKLCSATVQTLLTAAGRQTARAVSVGCGLAVTGLMIAVLGRAYGASGAVLALSLGEAAALVTAAVRARDLWQAPGTLGEARAAPHAGAEEQQRPERLM